VRFAQAVLSQVSPFLQVSDCVIIPRGSLPPEPTEVSSGEQPEVLSTPPNARSSTLVVTLITPRSLLRLCAIRGYSS
jgi:hypothetical protein